MLICEILTLIFIFLKITYVIDWAWMFILLPEIIAILFYMAITIIWIIEKFKL